jgi:hypothetical protein
VTSEIRMNILDNAGLRKECPRARLTGRLLIAATLLVIIGAFTRQWQPSLPLTSAPRYPRPK